MLSLASWLSWPGFPDWRRETEARGWEEVRRWPAFCWVFWRVRSLAASWGVEEVGGLVGEVETAFSEMGVVGLGMVGRDGGEWWKEFFSMPEVEEMCE
jgi:hypothetical protein